MSALSQYFTGVAMKRLVAGELPFDPIKGRNSTQHEFNSTREMVQLFGTERIESKPASYIFLSDEEEQTTVEAGTFSFYDARENQPHRSAEYRFYYNSKNSVLDKANEGDLLFIGKTVDKKEIFIIAEKNSTVEQQLMLLFELQIKDTQFQIKDISKEKKDLDFVQKYILNTIGIEVQDEAPKNYLEEILNLFGETFPSTLIFSKYARDTIKDVSPIEAPDKTLLIWMEREELLFKTLEKHIVQKKLAQGFGTDVEDFITFSLSIQNRRKSRAGRAFENHLSIIFDSHNIKYSNGKVTELNKKPDFIFPGIQQYHDQTFDINLLTLLGLKTTAKDRWRQVLSESNKIKNKHLITLEPAISKNQTDEMISEHLQLVLPIDILKTYSETQRAQLISLSDFINLVKKKQTIFET